MPQPFAYEPTAFETLPSFTTAQHNLMRAEGCLKASAQTISRHGADNVLGIALLHRHFALDSTEVLVEEVFPTQRLSIGRPRPRSAAEDILPHTFRAIRTDSGWRWQPVEFVDATHCAGSPEDTIAWLTQNDDFLGTLAATLDGAGAIDVFGISVSHGREEIECAEDEVLVESTDEERRVLQMEPRKLRDVKGITTPTNWSVSDGAVRMRCTCQRDQSGSHQHFETN